MSELLIARAKKYTTPFAILKIWVPDSLRTKYTEAIEVHNDKMEKNAFADSGFDLFLPREHIFTTAKGKVDYEVKCEMQTVRFLEADNSGIVEIMPTAFYLLPRSSISKMPLMMANSIGLIDSAYRGNIMAVFRYFAEECGGIDVPYKLDKYDRIVQIVHPSTYRIFVQLVDTDSNLTSTERGDGGFGSTGK
jgi:dUTP pyrophosphatase